MPQEPNISDIDDYRDPRGVRKDLIHDIGVSFNPRYWRYTRQNLKDIQDDLGRLRQGVEERINRFLRRR